LEEYEEDWKKFYCYLSEQVVKLRPDLIAEELSEDALSRFKATDSVARHVLQEAGCRHAFVDPGQKERDDLGIKGWNDIVRDFGYGPALRKEESAQVEQIELRHWEKREQYWLQQLRDIGFRTCIMVIGAKHIERFSNLLLEANINAEILVRDYGR
jgi:hypothetical protein